MTKISPSCAMSGGGRQPAHHQCAPTGVFAARQSAGTVQRPSRTCASNSARKCFTVVSAGVAAASPNAHSVLPTMLFADADQQIDVAHLPFAVLDARQDLVEPVAALAARRALAARLVLVEVEQVLRRPHHAGGLVHHDDAGRAQHRSRLRHVVEARRDVELIGQQDRHRRSAGNDRLQLMRRRACRRRSRRSAPCSVVFIDASKTPGFLTWPLTQNSFGPPFFSGPSAANHSAPFSRIDGRLQSVSTLLTAVGAL